MVYNLQSENCLSEPIRQLVVYDITMDIFFLYKLMRSTVLNQLHHSCGRCNTLEFQRSLYCVSVGFGYYICIRYDSVFNYKYVFFFYSFFFLQN